MKITPLTIPAIILILSFLIIFNNYSQIQHFTWDESYFSASVEKYNHNVAQMEAHPPLGKLLMFAGVKLTGVNKDLDTYYMTTATRIYSYYDEYSFAGMRLFPALFATLIPLLVYFICIIIGINKWISASAASFYLFDNAFVAMSRAALIEPIQLFFTLSAVGYFCYCIIRVQKIRPKNYVILTSLITLAILCKINAGILLIFLAALFVKELYDEKSVKKINNLTLKIAYSFLVASLILILVWQIHFAIGSQRPAETQEKFFSPEYIDIIKNGKTSSIISFPIMMQDTIRYQIVFQKYVAPHDPESYGGEFGSKPIGWPIGAKPIKYLERNQQTVTQKLYFVPNIVIWISALIGMLFSIYTIVRNKTKIIKDKHIFLLTVLVTAYISYIIFVSTITRALYLSHYLIPLSFAIMSCTILSNQAYKQKSKKTVTIIVFTVIGLAIIWFVWHSPFTYFIPLSYESFDARAITWLWEMH